MRSTLRANLVTAVFAVAAASVVGWLTLYGWALTDYDFEARPAFDALVQGHIHAFLQLAPGYGGSLIIRAPFVLATKVWGGGQLSIYRAAAAPCLLASVVFGAWLVAGMRAMASSRVARAVALGLCVANPLTLPALEIGHPEELLGAVLSAAAVLAAVRRRPFWAGLLLGLAIANKEWAVLAIGPVLAALPGQRWRALLAAAAPAALILAPLVAAGPFISQAKGAATQAAVIFNPWQVWWFLGGHVHTLRDAAGYVIPGHRWDHRVEPQWLSMVSHPLIVALGVPLSWLWARRRRHGRDQPAHHALLLLALLLLLRCALDPWDMPYYSLPFLFALLAWEATTAHRAPVIALAASFLAWFVLEWATPLHGFSPDEQSLLFDAVALPALAAIGAQLYLPGLWERVAVRIARRAPVPTPA